MLIDCKAFCHSHFLHSNLDVCFYSSIGWPPSCSWPAIPLRYLKWNAILHPFSSEQKMGLVWQNDKILTAAWMCDCWMKDMCGTWNNQEIKMFDKMEEECGKRMQHKVQKVLFISLCFYPWDGSHSRNRCSHLIWASWKCVVVCAKINDSISRNNKLISNISSTLFY